MVVVSAMGSHPSSPVKVTDLLINMVNKAANQDQEFLLDLTALQACPGGWPHELVTICRVCALKRRPCAGCARPARKGCRRGARTAGDVVPGPAGGPAARMQPARPHRARTLAAATMQKKHVECAEALLGPGKELNTFVARLLEDIANLKAMLQAISIGGCSPRGGG